jgi:hypothetical protein
MASLPAAAAAVGALPNYGDRITVTDSMGVDVGLPNLSTAIGMDVRVYDRCYHYRGAYVENRNDVIRINGSGGEMCRTTDGDPGDRPHVTWVSWPFLVLSRILAMVLGLAFWFVIGSIIYALLMVRVIAVVVLAETVGAITGRRGADFAKLDAAASIWPDGMRRMLGFLTDRTSISGSFQPISSWRDWSYEVTSAAILIIVFFFIYEAATTDWMGHLSAALSHPSQKMIDSILVLGMFGPIAILAAVGVIAVMFGAKKNSRAAIIAGFTLILISFALPVMFLSPEGRIVFKELIACLKS